MIWILIISYWLLTSMIVTFALCRCIHKSKVRDEIVAGTTGVFEA